MVFGSHSKTRAMYSTPPCPSLAASTAAYRRRSFSDSQPKNRCIFRSTSAEYTSMPHSLSRGLLRGKDTAAQAIREVILDHILSTRSATRRWRSISRHTRNLGRSAAASATTAPRRTKTPRSGRRTLTVSCRRRSCFCLAPDGCGRLKPWVQARWRTSGGRYSPIAGRSIWGLMGTFSSGRRPRRSIANCWRFWEREPVNLGPDSQILDLTEHDWIGIWPPSSQPPEGEDSSYWTSAPGAGQYCRQEPSPVHSSATTSSQWWKSWNLGCIGATATNCAHGERTMSTIGCRLPNTVVGSMTLLLA